MHITWRQFVRFWYFLSMAVIMAGLPFSKLLISLGQMMMAGGWIVGWFDEEEWFGRLRGRPSGYIARKAVPFAISIGIAGIARGFRHFFSNRAALLFASLWLLHIVGLIWTTDFGYAVKDLRTKFPIFLLPLLLSASGPIDGKNFRRMMFLFILAVLFRSLYNTWLISAHRFIDIRDVSQNVSHIIFSLLLALCIYSLGYFALRRRLLPFWLKIPALAVMAWFCIYIILSQSFTGLAVCLLTLAILVPVLAVKARSLAVKVVLVGGILVITAGIFFTLRSYVKDYYRVTPVDFSKLDTVTSRGNRYINAAYATETDNGNYLWIYIQWDELRSAWNLRSKIPFDSLNLKSGPVAYTVIRYLNSKGWRKDADAVEKLKPGEIAAIEKGIANHLFVKEFGMRGRIYEFLWGWDNYRATGNPTGSTVMQRLEFWKASVGIIRDNWLTGVGTGDMNLAFKLQYEKMNTKLAPGQRWRSHNQFLSIFVGFGIFGLIWFLAAIFYPPAMLRRYDDYFFLVFLIIAVLSLLTGDTIESQTGVTFFALFYCLFLFARQEKDPIMVQTQ